MTRREIRDDVLRRVRIDDPDNAPDHVIADVVTAINQALQTLYLIPGGDFYTLSDYEVTVATGTNSIALSSAIQRLDSVRLASGVPLGPVFAREDILNYRRRYEGALAEDGGTPVAYWLEQRRAASGAAADASACTLFVAPTPESDTLLKLEGKSEATIYTVVEMESAQAGIAIAHRYVQSILLPLARFKATECAWFKDDALGARLKSASESAFAAVGLSAPWLATADTVTA